MDFPHPTPVTPPPTPDVPLDADEDILIFQEYSNQPHSFTSQYKLLQESSKDQQFDYDQLFFEDEIKLDFVKRLPPEISWELFTHLEPKDISLCGAVSRTWRSYARSELLWNLVCRRAWRNRQFHPLELHPLVNWGPYNNLSLSEILQILHRRGVVLRPPTVSQPASANWPSNTYPVSLSSWSWGNWNANEHNVPGTLSTWDSTDNVPDEDTITTEPIDFPTEEYLPWLKRLLSVTFPLHAPPSIPTSCGKWMASYVAAERDRKRTRITRSELSSITWKFHSGNHSGFAEFRENGVWTSDSWPHYEWWKLRRDGRPQINFYSPLTVHRRDEHFDGQEPDWGFVLVNEFMTFVSVDNGSPPISLGMDGDTPTSRNHN
ncbi:hypothetical protein BCR33DRAFT_767984 [Rhizoclosmatium globosum]|uniref:F-box domain-containing protein n=1 Tax=Rhizoclosmatium globosum TaxID=329046 RepID=A0A1Y2BZZ2_9FUNG|nr:hypothetical protein BCR33DRAFT_767984 [Rhizoclosmatium globosum]|eukprot:ORY40363.1 hypothetical protein BCR33DRAFT_767984 [Rhizoclosmatium globosum]